MSSASEPYHRNWQRRQNPGGLYYIVEADGNEEWHVTGGIAHPGDAQLMASAQDLYDALTQLLADHIATTEMHITYWNTEAEKTGQPKWTYDVEETGSVIDARRAIARATQD